MLSKILQLTVGSHDLSQDEKKTAVFANWTTEKMAPILTQLNFVHPGQFWVLFFELDQLYKEIIVFSAWDKSCNSGAIWSKLEHM